MERRFHYASSQGDAANVLCEEQVCSVIIVRVIHRVLTFGEHLYLCEKLNLYKSRIFAQRYNQPPGQPPSLPQSEAGSRWKLFILWPQNVQLPTR
ncbi:hypothetical protein J6590_010585 [Homalodisca vitripennis]|nr:hypothetical protein J6590_010585 [Homalodisca vitripennis]